MLKHTDRHKPLWYIIPFAISLLTLSISKLPIRGSWFSNVGNPDVWLLAIPPLTIALFIILQKYHIPIVIPALFDIAVIVICILSDEEKIVLTFQKLKMPEESSDVVCRVMIMSFTIYAFHRAAGQFYFNENIIYSWWTRMRMYASRYREKHIVHNRRDWERKQTAAGVIFLLWAVESLLCVLLIGPTDVLAVIWFVTGIALILPAMHLSRAIYEEQ